MELTINNTGWYCDDCGSIYDYDIIVNFKGKTLTAYCDNHFGNGDLDSEFDSQSNLIFIFDYFKDELLELGLTQIESIEYGYDEDNSYYDITVILNNNKETIRVNEYNLIQETFKHIGIDLQIETIDNSNFQRYDYDDYE